MSEVSLATCAGLWRRVLLVEADGSRDTGTDVVWLQGDTAYVDSRGFAGTLTQAGSVFTWHRAVDQTPPGAPDEGEMRWEEDTLVETGVHADYVEHWRRDEGAATPRWAAFLTGADGAPGVLLRVGDRFGVAVPGTVVVGVVGDATWQTIRFTPESVDLDGVAWHVARTEGEVIP